MLLFPFLDRDERDRRIVRWAGQLVRIVGGRVKVFGRAPMVRGGGALIVANHVSWLDIHALHSVLPARFISKAERPGCARSSPATSPFCKRSSATAPTCVARRPTASMRCAACCHRRRAARWCSSTPSYELLADYERLVDTLEDAMRRFATGCYLVWYPIVQRAEALELPSRLLGLGPPRWLRAELRVRAAPAGGYGLYGSGMFVINPPWTPPATLQETRPRLAQRLALDDQASHSLDFHLP